MYYGDSDDPYSTNLKYYFKEHLPMDEFAKGNFSQANKIIDIYREYLKDCIASATHQHTGGEEKISTYLEKQLANLKQQHKERTDKKAQAIKDMEDAEKDISKEKQALKDEGKGDKIRKIFFDFRDQNSYDCEMLQRAFENTKEDQPQKYEENKELFEKFFALAQQIDHKKLEELEKKHYDAKEARNKATHTLSHKSNRMNLEKQIDDINTGNESKEIQEKIREDIFKLFKKMDHLDHIVDNRSLQEMFTSIMATDLITDCKTDKKVKKDLIKNHTDKIGLFNHIRRIYRDNSQMFLQIETGRERSRGSEYYGELMEEKVEQIIEESKKILKRIPAISGYFRLDRDTTPEEIEARKNKGDKQRKDIVIEDLVIHLKKSLNEPEKKGHRRREPDKKTKKLFEGIYIITDNHEFENYCEKLRNIDANRYREILGTEGSMLMRQIYQAMDEEEQSIIANEYDARGVSESVIKNVEMQKEHEKDKQLKLFDFAPIYNLDGYVEKSKEDIKLQIKDLSYHQMRNFERAIQKMLHDQGYKKYIDTGTYITSFSDEVFIQTVKTIKGGKALSTILKKANVKLLPDINERITEMKKTVKADII